MANHTNKVFVIRLDKQDWLTGDEYNPNVTDNVMRATRKAYPCDAKKFRKAVAKKMKIDQNRLEVVSAMETRDEKFNLIDVFVVGPEEHINKE